MPSNVIPFPLSPSGAVRTSSRPGPTGPRAGGRFVRISGEASGGPLSGLGAWFAGVRLRRAMTARLDAMSDGELADLGLTRAEARREIVRAVRG